MNINREKNDEINNGIRNSTSSYTAIIIDGQYCFFP